MRLLMLLAEQVVVSAVAGVLLLWLAPVTLKSFRRAVTVALSELLGAKVWYVYRNEDDAAPEITEAIARSSEVRIFTSRGNAFRREMYKPLLEGVDGRKPRSWILLPDPNESRRTDWVHQREQELVQIDQTFGDGMLKREIQTNLDALRRHLEGGRFEVRLFDMPHMARVILTDDSLFLTPYKERRHGRHSRIFRFARGDMYDMYLRFFGMVWKDSREVPK